MLGVLFQLAPLLAGINVAPTIVVLAIGIGSEFEPWTVWSNTLLMITGLWAVPGVLWLVDCLAADHDIRQKNSDASF